MIPRFELCLSHCTFTVTLSIQFNTDSGEKNKERYCVCDYMIYENVKVSKKCRVVCNVKSPPPPAP